MRRQAIGPTSRPPDCDLAVLVHEFPKLSETFVLADLLALEEAGVRLHVFSVRGPQVGVEQEEVQRLHARVEYLPDVQARGIGPLLRASWAMLFLRNPKSFLSGLAESYASPDFSRARLRQALLLARRLDRLGSPPLYIHFAHRPATIGRFASLMLGTPFAISAHAVDVWTTPVKELRIKLRDAELVLSCYREAQEYLARLARGHTPVELAYHGVVLPPRLERREASPPMLLAIGRLIEKKGFDTLLRAAALLAERGLDFRLVIAGEGPLWATLQRQANDLGLEERVRFLGPVNQRELEPYFASAAIFVLPCQVTGDGNRDGLPNTLLEAMARRVPVVSTTLDSIREAVPDEQYGLLVPPRDHVALAEALVSLIEDPRLRNRLGTAGQARVTQFFDRRVFRARVSGLLAAAGMIADNTAGGTQSTEVSAPPESRVHPQAAAFDGHRNKAGRLLYLSADPGVPVFGGKGASIHLQSLVVALQELGVEVTVASPRLEPGPNSLPEGIRFAPIPAVRPRECGSPEEVLEQCRRQAAAVTELARELQIEGIYERYSLAGMSGAHAAHVLHIPLVVEVNAPLRSEERRFRQLEHESVALRAERETFRMARCIFVVSRALRSWLLAEGIDADRIQVMGNAAPDAAFALDHEVGQSEELVVGFAGALKPWHGVDTLAEGFALAVQQGASLRLEILGQGPAEDVLERDGLPAERIRRLGALAYPQALEVLGGWDIGAAPFSSVPGFYFSPLKLFEYMAAGLCPVVSAVGELPEIVEHGHAGVIVAPNDPRALADALLELDADRERLRELAARARSAAAARPGWRENAQRVVKALTPSHTEPLTMTGARR